MGSKIFYISSEILENGVVDYSVKVNQKFEIALLSNPSTGHFWELETENIKLIEYIKRYHVSDQICVRGGGGTDYFCFKALNIGQQQIVIKINGYDYDKQILQINLQIVE